MNELPVQKKLSRDALKLIKEQDLIFQAISWYGDDFPDNDMEDVPDEIDEPVSYQIYIHGREISKNI